MRKLPSVLAALVSLFLGGWVHAAETITHPFTGVMHIARNEASPRPVKMHIVIIDLKAPGVRFHLTPHIGPEHTTKQTTLQFLTEQKAQVAINAHFFEPWPPPKPDPGTARLIGLAASNGDVYAPFDANPPKQYAIRPNAPALNIDADNHATLVHRKQADPGGYGIAEPVKLHNAVAGNEQILTDGTVTAGTGKWENTPNPLTVIGLAPGDKLVLFTVDGRQSGVSEGLTTAEAAALLHKDYQVTDAINLDGGGSTTLCMADPEPRVVNVPVGDHDKPGTLRLVGSSLAIFAKPPEANGHTRQPGNIP
ncbi:MAG: phosphodiester glycosidase family protein [Tepidisphaerales bacterium]